MILGLYKGRSGAVHERSLQLYTRTRIELEDPSQVYYKNNDFFMASASNTK